MCARTEVGIGASAGGLGPIKKIIAALPADSGLAYIIIQHLDPAHESLDDDAVVRDLEGELKAAKEELQAALPNREKSATLCFWPLGRNRGGYHGCLLKVEPESAGRNDGPV